MYSFLKFSFEECTINYHNFIIKFDHNRFHTKSNYSYKCVDLLEKHNIIFIEMQMEIKINKRERERITERN
jgi:hypothetical protein